MCICADVQKQFQADEADKPREWFINPVVGYKCEVNENGIGLSGNEIHVIERSAYDKLKAERDQLRNDSATIAELTEKNAQLSAERDRYKAALAKIAAPGQAGSDAEVARRRLEIARKALEEK